MALSSNFDLSPYYDDYQELKDFYRVMFKPGVPVQTRELNQLQSLFQQQIERFADNIFQKGTIIDGCGITYHNVFPYVKIKDTTTTGEAITVSDFEGYYLKNSANLQAYVVTSVSGYESQSPDLNTMYIRYINSGNDSNTTAFSANQVLTVFKPDNRIYDVDIVNGSTGFSNSDNLVITSALAVQNSIGGTTFASGFYAGDYIDNGAGANVEIISVDTSTNTDVVILKIKPQEIHLVSGNSLNWSIYADEGIVDANTGETATVVDLIGQGATGTIRTNSVGKVTNVNIATSGSGYYVSPHVAIQTASANTLQATTLSLNSQNFLCQLTVGPELSSPAGTGYGITVSEGVVFQKGHFQRVEEQLLVVEKYSNTPDVKVVGFVTNEEIVTSNVDESLLDNATGTPNETAPGADRLKLTPVLTVLDKDEAEANNEFFTIVEFAQGEPFKHNKQTVYSIIGKEMARRTYEESGNYVVDQFILNTKSVTPFANEASQFVVSVDPGLAYIQGNRVETVLNYKFTADKALDTIVSNNASISLNYGNYIKVNDVGGVFDFDTASQLVLYDTATNYLTTPGTAITPAGNIIGYTRARSFVRESGTQGSPNAVYRLYLFDIRMNAGKNFKDVKAVYHNGTNKGIADVVLVDGDCKLYDTNLTASTWTAGLRAVKNANNLTYTYRTFNQSLSANTSGIIQKTLGAGETFTTTGVWGDVDKNKLVVIPLANVTSSANLAGSVTTSTTDPGVVGSGTSFLTTVSPGNYIRFANTTANGYGRVLSVTNSTYLTLSSNASIAITGANVATYFPQNVPINLTPSNRTVNVSANGSVLTINLGANTNSANVAVAYDVRTANVAPVSKTVSRNCWVRLRLANNEATEVGPWCLGISDVFRLRGVYKGANNTFAHNDTGVTDVTNDFYIDHNQNESFYDTSYLYKKPKSNLTIANTDVLLVKLDAFQTGSEGLKTLQSYPIDDTVPLANATSTVNTLELPEMYSTKDVYYDIRDQLDLRPVSANTANVTSTLANLTINPVEPAAAARFSATSKKFPSPDSQLTGVIEYYVDRTDRVVVNANGDIEVLKGEAGKPSAPVEPKDALTINLLKIPAYPSIPFSMSSNLVQIIDTKVANEKYANRRIENFKITTPITASKRMAYQPRGYTMGDLGKLEARIADLEYYLARALAEIDAQKPVNDSSGVSRTKYGYFSDSYNNTSKCDIYNPEFFASVINGRLVPKIEDLAFEMETEDYNTGDIASLPFSEYTLISQLDATDGAVVVANNTSNTTSNTVTSNTTTVVQRITYVTVYNKNTLAATNWSVYEESEFMMSATAGPCELYYNSRQDKIAIEIFQGTEPGFAVTGTPFLTAATAANIGLANYYLKMKGVSNFSYSGINTHGNLGSPSKFVVSDDGKITWTHNPANGQYYKVRIYKYNKDGSKAEFVYRLYYPVDSVENIANTTTTTTNFVYTGTAVDVQPRNFTIQSSFTYAYEGAAPEYHFCDSQKFTITVSGLKPSTNHNFVFDNVDKSSLCQQVGKAYGAQMVSDTSGLLTFDFYYDAGLTEITSDYEQYQALAASIAGIKNFSIRSIDNQSVATGSINIKNYVQEAINTDATADTVISAKINFEKEQN